jgi:hypothetical protein
MPYPVNYEIEIPYRALPGIPGQRPWLDVTLSRGDYEAGAAGLVDSGSTHTVFSQQYAELLGISEITSGHPLSISTAGGTLTAYLFDDVEMVVNVGGVDYRSSSNIGFAAGRLSRNILGVNLLFFQFLIGFHDSHQRFYLLKDHSSAMPTI